MDFGLDSLFREIAGEDVGVGGRHALAAEEVGPFVVHRPGNGQREAAASEAEVHELFDREALFGHLVQPHDTQIGDPHRDGLRNVVVAQVEDFERKPFRAGNQFAFALGDPDTRFGEQFEALFIEPAFGLDGDFQHVLSVFLRHPPAAMNKKRAHPAEGELVCIVYGLIRSICDTYT